MTKPQEQLLNLLSNALFANNTSETLSPEIYEEAKKQAVSALVSSTDYKTIAQNLRVINAHAELSALLTGIPFTTFKGFASANYYLKPENRSMGDVDFIIDPSYYQETVERLTEDGWKRTQTEHVRHEGFRKNRIEIELHCEIKGIPNGADGIVTDSTTAEEKVRELLSDLIETAVTVETQEGKITIPDDFHHGLIMLLHVAGHMINDGGIGLRHLCDWAVYVNRVDVDTYREKLENIGLWTFACQLTALSSRYFGLPDQQWAGEWKEEFLETFIEDILAAGNFGRKEAGRIGSMTLERTSFVEMTKNHYPMANYHLLLPFFMIAYVTRYGFLIITGKRKLIRLSTLTGAKRRNELYRQFRLFET